MRFTKFAFLSGLMTFKPPESFPSQSPVISTKEASCPADVERYKTIMNEAGKKAFEHIRLFRTKMNIPGISVAISVNKSQTLTHSYGYSNVENLSAMKPTTVVEVGGMCSIFSRLLLCKHEFFDNILKQRLSDTIGDELPDVLSDVTVRDLLSHETGMENLDFNMLTKDPDNDYKTCILNEMRNISTNERQNYLYSPLNELAISLLVADVLSSDNLTHAQGLANLFRDFNMCSTRLATLGERFDNKASLYDRTTDGLGLRMAQIVNPKHRRSFIGVFSTATDLVNFGRRIVLATQNRCEDQGGMTSEQIRRLFKVFRRRNDYSGTEDRGRPRLGFYQGVGFKLLDPLPWNGIDKPEEDRLAYVDGSGAGSSSIIYLKGCRILRKALQKSPEVDCVVPPPREFDGAVVAIVCNLKGVKLFELADTIANIYEQAYMLYEAEREERRTGFI